MRVPLIARSPRWQKGLTWYPRTLADIRAALEAAVEFTNGDAPGVRLRRRK
jgi:hypothetical protein